MSLRVSKGWLKFSRRCVFALFALAQLMPAGFAVASDDKGDFTFVICTAHGQQTVSWEDVTGEPSPFETPDDPNRGQPCHACMTTCRIAAAEEVRFDRIEHPAPLYYPVADRVAAAAPVLFVTRPPMPSRAPPLRAV